MKKYKVLREMPFAKVGDVFTQEESTHMLNKVDHSDGSLAFYCSQLNLLISEGWLAEVPEEKELWEKLMVDDTSDPPIQETLRGYWKDKAKWRIAKNRIVCKRKDNRLGLVGQ